MNTIPQTMQAIRQNVTATVTDLVGAQNRVRALLERPALPQPQADLIGDTLPQMLATVSSEFAATADAFADLAQFVHGWTTAPVQVTPSIPVSDIIASLTPEKREQVADIVGRPLDPIPQPIVTSPLASDLHKPIAITATETTPTPEPEPEPTPTEEPDSDDESATTADLAHTTNRVAAHLNGHCVPGAELATVLASPAVEEVAPEDSDGGKRGGRKPRNSRKKS